MSSSISTVKEKHAPHLLAKPGVISVGIGQGTDGQPVIIVGADSEETLKKLALPEDLEGYSVKVHVIGVIRAQ